MPKTPDALNAVARAAAVRMVARIGASAMQAATLVFIARETDLGQFGQLMITFSVVVATGIFLGFGAQGRALRAAGEPDSEALLRSMWIGHSTVVACILIAGSGVISIGHWGPGVWTGLAFGVSDLLNNFAQPTLSSLRRHGAATLIVVAQRALPLAAVVYCVITGAAVYLVLIVAFAATAVMGLVSVLPLRGTFVNPLRGSFHYWTYTLTWMFQHVESPAVGATAGRDAAGVYAIAARVAGPISLFSAAVSQVVIPELSRRCGSAEFDRLFTRFWRASLAMSFLVAAGSWPIAEMVVVIAGPQYEASRVLIFAMVIAAAITVCSQALNAKLIALGFAKEVTRCISCGGFLSIGILLLLGSTGDTNLLAIAPLTAQTITFLMLSSVSRRVGDGSSMPSAEKIPS